MTWISKIYIYGKGMQCGLKTKSNRELRYGDSGQKKRIYRV
jgi:hypothetical protein